MLYVSNTNYYGDKIKSERKQRKGIRKFLSGFYCKERGDLRLGHSLALFFISFGHDGTPSLPQYLKKISQRLTALPLTFIVEPALNHCRRKLQADPRAGMARSQSDNDYQRQRREEYRAKTERQERDYRASVQATGLNGWQQYCKARGIDPNTSAADVARRMAQVS